VVYNPNPPILRNVQTELDISAFPAGAAFLVFSLWAYQNNARFAILVDDPTGTGKTIFFDWSYGGGTSSIATTVSSGAVIPGPGNNIIVNGSRTSVPPDSCSVNILVSIDLAGEVFQAYCNDQEMLLNDSIVWQVARTFGATTGACITTEQTVYPPGPDFQNKYFSDLWLGSTASFFDLSIEANRRKFISADITPADVGSTGQTPFGTAPQIYQNVPTASVDPLDWLPNRGTVGGTFVQNTGTLTLEGNPCAAPPTSETAAITDLWFGATSGFVDLRGESERRKFIGLDGSTQYLGVNGERPFSAAPPVFLARTVFQTANQFAFNHGTGGTFAITDGPLTEDGAAPPSGAYTIPIEVDPNTPQGADPQVMLSVSDDGGRTFSLLQKWRSLGKIGEYTKRLRWLKMGQFRQRQIRLEITDPVRRNIVGVYTDVTPGLEGTE